MKNTTTRRAGTFPIGMAEIHAHCLRGVVTGSAWPAREEATNPTQIPQNLTVLLVDATPQISEPESIACPRKIAPCPRHQ